MAPEVLKRKRKLQHNVTIAKKKVMIKWMQDDIIVNGDKTIPTRMIRQFEEEFKGANNANLNKASRIWKDRNAILNLSLSSISSKHTVGRIKLQLKAAPGRGRKKAAYTKWLTPLLADEFRRLIKLGVKMSPHLLQEVALTIIKDSGHALYNMDTLISGISIVDKITSRWVQTFMESNQIVRRLQTGKLSVSPGKRIEIDISVVKFLGQVKRSFDSGLLDERCISNMDETHFVVNVDNGK